MRVIRYELVVQQSAGRATVSITCTDGGITWLGLTSARAVVYTVLNLVQSTVWHHVPVARASHAVACTLLEY